MPARVICKSHKDQINTEKTTFRTRLNIVVFGTQGYSKKISNGQELIQSDPTSCTQNQKGNNLIHKLTAVYERDSR